RLRCCFVVRKSSSMLKNIVRHQLANNKLHYQQSIIILALTIVSCPVIARFSHVDAEQIDPEPTDSELVIDAKSYEFFESSKSKWEDSKNGYRISAGSLNANRFYLIESIKLFSASDTSLNFFYTRERKEDLSEAMIDEVLRLQWAWQSILYTSLLADGNTHKKHGDLGFAVGIGDYSTKFIEIYYYQVDLYYNYKEPLADNRLSKTPATIGMQFNHTIHNNLVGKGKFEYDRPTNWQIQSEDRKYFYHRSQGEIHLEWQKSTQTKFILNSFYDHKSEGLEKISMPDEVENMKRITYSLDLYNVASENSSIAFYKSGIQFYSRAYNFSSSPILTEHKSIKRKELTLYLLNYNPLINTEKIFFQRGVFVSRVHLQKSKNSLSQISENTEIKLLTALEKILGEKSSVVLNANWNIDQLYKNFPYNKKRFLPWNGGNVQLQIQF
ncbi:MAG: hypothetical protein R3B45_16910, partial [Bdellovibrionota bacterium]